MAVVLVASVLGLGCAHGPASPRAAPAPLHYRIQFSSAPAPHLDVEVQLPAGHPVDFVLGNAPSIPEVRATDGDGQQEVLRPGADGVVTVPAGVRTLRYRYTFSSAVRGAWGVVAGAHVGADAVVAGRSYLLRPVTPSPSGSVVLEITGSKAALPWEPTAPGRYELREMDLLDAGFHTFGGRRCLRTVPGATLEIVLMGSSASTSDERLCDWVESSAREVLTVRRSFPFTRVLVTAVPAGGSRASPFGMMLWSNPPSMALLFGRAAAPEAFDDDWVAVHELLHLAHPSFQQQGAWLSEGLATYLTELARMRSGRFTEVRGWTELALGFQRGERGSDGSPLSQGGGGFHALYWGGALTCLELDLEIRRATDDAKSLDDVLELLGARGMTGTLEAFGEAVDATAGARIWTPVTTRRLAAPATAGWRAVLERLGVSLVEGRAVLSDSAPEAALRRSLGRARQP